MGQTGQLVTDRRARPMRFVELDTGCFVCLSHRPNADGYLRKGYGNSRDRPRRLEMFHRTIYRLHKGELPDEGWEVDHNCNIRLCCNPAHLEARPRTEHLVLTNMNRYAVRKAEAKAWWLAHRCKGVELAAKFGVSDASGCLWIREWKRCSQ